MLGFGVQICFKLNFEESFKVSTVKRFCPRKRSNSPIYLPLSWKKTSSSPQILLAQLPKRSASLISYIGKSLLCFHRRVGTLSLCGEFSVFDVEGYNQCNIQHMTRGITQIIFTSVSTYTKKCNKMRTKQEEQEGP